MPAGYICVQLAAVEMPEHKGRQRGSVLHTGARELAHSQTNREPGRGAGDAGKQR